MRGVEHDAVAVQVRIERARRVVAEHRAQDIPGDPVGDVTIGVDTCPSEPFQFRHRHLNRTVVGVNDSGILSDQCDHGDRLRRGKREIEEHAPVGNGLRLTIVAGYGSRGLEPLREQFTSVGIEIVTEAQELVALHLACQPQGFRADAVPLTGNLFALTVVVTDTEVFLEVLLRIDQIALHFPRQHEREIR